jgi:hypothetical protein
MDRHLSKCRLGGGNQKSCKSKPDYHSGRFQNEGQSASRFRFGKYRANECPAANGPPHMRVKGAIALRTSDGSTSMCWAFQRSSAGMLLRAPTEIMPPRTNNATVTVSCNWRTMGISIHQLRNYVQPATRRRPEVALPRLVLAPHALPGRSARRAPATRTA